MLAFDHVIVRVEDLDEATERFERLYGLRSVPGGRHPGFGTANRLVLFDHGYIELLAVVDDDEYAASGFRLPAGDALVGWMVRTDELQAVAARLDLTVRSMGRDHEGRAIAWQVGGLEQLMLDPGLPVMIDWSPEQEHHPAHDYSPDGSGLLGVSWIEVSGDRQRLEQWCNGLDMDVRVIDGPSAVCAVGLRTADGELELRY